jgi:nardilysin
VEGFSHKLPLLAEFVFSTLSTLNPAPDAFSRVKESLVRRYRNANTRPLKHATYLRLRAVKDRIWDSDEVLVELESATVEEVRAFLPTILGEGCHIEALVYGNLKVKQTLELANKVRALLGPSTAIAAARLADCAVRLPAGADLLQRVAAKNPEEDNSVVEAYWQFGVDSPGNRALADMMEQVRVQ